MVWKSLKRIACMVAVLAVLMAQPLTARAASYSVYDGSISTTYITIFQDIHIPVMADYVFFRSGQYEYTMVVGDFTETSGEISSSSEVTVYAITTNSGYASTYTYEVRTETGFSLSPGTALIYSNLGNYPDLIERNDVYALSAVLLLLIGICLYLCRSIFGFCFRFRNGNK